jgi:hypothetical protein
MELKDIYNYESELIRFNWPRNRLFNSIRKMTLPEWQFDKAILAANPDLRTIVDTTPYNAIENAAISMSNSYPKIDIAPYAANADEYKRAEKLETVAQMEMRKSNERGTGTVLYDKARNALTYNMICTRIDDLAYLLPKDRSKWTRQQKRAFSQGRFIRRVYDARTIFPELSEMGLVGLVHAQTFRAMDVFNYWKLYEGTDAKAAAAVRQMREHMGKKDVDVNGLWFKQFEYITDDRIVKHGHFTAQSTDEFSESGLPGNADEIVFADEENQMGFINWSVRIGGSRSETQPEYQVNPILASVHWSGIWETVNIVGSIVYSEPIKRLQEAHQFQETNDGQRLPESDDGVVVGRHGDKVVNLTPPVIDTNAPNIVQGLKEGMSQQTGAQVMGDITAASRTPFATLNAMIQVAQGRLDVQRRDIGLSEKDDILNMFRWVEFDQVPLTAYRQKAKSASMMGQQMMFQAGEQLTVTPDEFSADEMCVTVEIKPKNPTDYQQEVLTAIQLHDKLHVPLAVVRENLGFDNNDLIDKQWIDEQYESAETQASVQHIIDAQALADQMAAQGAQQPQEPTASTPNAGGGISQTAMGDTSGGEQGMNPAGGANPATIGAPGMTREMITGMDQSGMPLGAGG